MKPKLDLTGQRFGKLLVTSFIGKRGTQFYWRCACDCGGAAEAKTANLRSGNSTSCGCQRGQAQIDLVAANTKHDKHDTLTYRRWKSMRQRTGARRSKHHAQYYKDVQCCERWADFEAFLADMGECPEGHTLDRFPNASGNYEPGNCRWATMADQNANRSICIMITRDGVTKTATEWARTLGLKPTTVIERLRRGWSHERALAIGDQRVRP